MDRQGFRKEKERSASFAGPASKTEDRKNVAVARCDAEPSHPTSTDLCFHYVSTWFVHSSQIALYFRNINMHQLHTSHPSPANCSAYQDLDFAIIVDSFSITCSKKILEDS
jgi:hypothetical protein